MSHRMKPSVSVKKKFEPLHVIVRPNSFAPNALKSQMEHRALTRPGSIVPRAITPAFGGMPFEETPSPSNTPTDKGVPTPLETGKRRKRPRKRLGGAVGSSPQSVHTLGRIHALVTTKGDGKEGPGGNVFDFRDGATQSPDVSTKAGSDADAQLEIAAAAIVRDIQNAKKKARFKCAGLAVIGRRIQAFTGLGAQRAWKLLNPVSVKLGRSMLLSGKDVLRFRAAFNAIDLDGSSTVDFDEFFESFYQTRTPFTDYVFTLLDDPSSLIKKMSPEERQKILNETGVPAMWVRGRMSFDDYFQVCCIFGTYTREDILRFAFESFDADKSGTIDADEYHTLCKVVNNFNPLYPGNFQYALTAFDVNHDGKLSFEEFKGLNHKYPMILFPAFQLQDEMQSATLGHKRWLQINENIKMRHYLDQYRRVHNGSLPMRTGWEMFKSCGIDKRWKRYNLQRGEPAGDDTAVISVKPNASASVAPHDTAVHTPVLAAASASASASQHTVHAHSSQVSLGAHRDSSHTSRTHGHPLSKP